MKLFQVTPDGSLWAVFAVSKNDPNNREFVRGWTSDERFAIDLAATLNGIAATYEVECDKANEVELSKELGVPDQRINRSITFEDV